MSILMCIGVLSSDGRRGTSHLGQHSFFVNSYSTSDVLFKASAESNALDAGYMRFTVGGGVESIEASRLKRITHLGLQPKVVMWVQYYWHQRPQVVDLLREMLKRFGGYVETAFSQELFSENNLSEILALKHPDE